MAHMSERLDLGSIKKFQRKFAKARDWDQFHTPKNLSIALTVEAAELMEHFQWLTADEAKRIARNPAKAKAISEELADILYYLVRLSDVLGVDLEQAFWLKMRENEAKYPVKLARGNARKYTELRKKK
jgi:NTP pyrophosphatase (non-canonical NTP hydrolase)